MNNRRPRTPLTAALVMTCVALAESASAGVGVFTDRAAFLAEIGTPSFNEDFEFLTNDVEFSFTTIVGTIGFSIEHSGTDPFRNFIDVTPLETADGNGSNGLSLFVDAESNGFVTITPDFVATSFGADFSSAGGGEGALLTFTGSTGVESLEIELSNGIDDFFGVVATGGDFITSIILVGEGDGFAPSGEGFFADNLVGTFLIPEPRSLLSVLSGVLLLSLRSRQGAGS